MAQKLDERMTGAPQTESLHRQFTGAPIRSGLVLAAAETALPEDDVGSLPDYAREEVAAGLAGRVRNELSNESWPLPMTQGANYRQDVADYQWRCRVLRDELLAEFGAERDPASDVIVRVYLSRVLRGTVPAVVGVSCLTWYSAVVADEPEVMELLAEARRLTQRWVSEQDSRPSVEATIYEFARGQVGRNPPDYLDIQI